LEPGSKPPQSLAGRIETTTEATTQPTAQTTSSFFLEEKKSILFETSHWPIAEAIPPYQNCLTSPANELKASCYHLYRKETVDKYLPEYETIQNVIKSTYVKSFMLLDKDENI
jgi:hypothetical protein